MGATLGGSTAADSSNLAYALTPVIQEPKEVKAELRNRINGTFGVFAMARPTSQAPSFQKLKVVDMGRSTSQVMADN